MVRTMGQALYRKYRSKSLDEIVGQSHIITTLRNALKSGAISHAYLFTGPRGVGKTSIARILAHEVNGLEYNEAAPHIDIIEIDAASNRRIDEIRDLRDKVHIAPTSCKYKVYIIDEVHMLTKEAFNALLKTLEEPPAHVIFILATTEVHKLPETIVSRTQRFTFKPIERSKAVAHMKDIAKKEKIKISDEALELVAQHGDGSFRDSISLLDQVSNISSSVSADDIRQMLGIAPQEAVEELYNCIFAGTPKDIVDCLRATEERGYEAGHIAKQLAALIRQRCLDQTLANAPLATDLLRQLIDVPASGDPSAYLEVTLLGCNLKSNPQAAPAAAAVAAPKAAPTLTSAPKPAPAPVAEHPVKAAEPKPAPAEDSKPAITVAAVGDIDKAWHVVLDAVRKQYNTLYGLLRMAQVTTDESGVTLGFKFAFHQKRLNEPKNKQIVIDLLEQAVGHPVSVQCTVAADAPAAPAAVAAAPPAESAAAPGQVPAEPPAPEALSTISNIFGGAEVLES